MTKRGSYRNGGYYGGVLRSKTLSGAWWFASLANRSEIFSRPRSGQKIFRLAPVPLKNGAIRSCGSGNFLLATLAATKNFWIKSIDDFVDAA